MYKGWYPIGASSHFEKAVELKEKGDLDGAMIEFNEAIRLCSEYAEAYIYLGDIYFAKGMVDEGINAYKTGIEKHSDWRKPVMYLTLADILYEHKRFDEACHYYEDTLKHFEEEGVALKMPHYYKIYLRYLETKGESLFDINETGDTKETAVRIRNAPDEIIGIAAEKDYLRRKFSDKEWQVVKQEFFETIDGKKYDILFLEFADKTKKIVYFDITDFYGKHPVFLEGICWDEDE